MRPDQNKLGETNSAKPRHSSPAESLGDSTGRVVHEGFQVGTRSFPTTSYIITEGACDKPRLSAGNNNNGYSGWRLSAVPDTQGYVDTQKRVLFYINKKLRAQYEHKNEYKIFNRLALISFSNSASSFRPS